MLLSGRVIKDFMIQGGDFVKVSAANAWYPESMSLRTFKSKRYLLPPNFNCAPDHLFHINQNYNKILKRDWLSSGQFEH